MPLLLLCPLSPSPSLALLCHFLCCLIGAREACASSGPQRDASIKRLNRQRHPYLLSFVPLYWSSHPRSHPVLMARYRGRRTSSSSSGTGSVTRPRTSDTPPQPG